MTWLATLNCRDNRNWLNPVFRNNDALAGDHWLECGSVVIETRLSHEARPRKLVSVPRTGRETSGLSVQILPTGGIVLVVETGTDVLHQVLHRVVNERDEVLRVTFSWDARASLAQLAVERPEKDFADIWHLEWKGRIRFQDLLEMTTPYGRAVLDTDVDSIALSDVVEPVGPMPALAGFVPVETSLGLRPAARIRRGDLVRTASGDLMPVLKVVRRQVPSVGSFAPVRLRAPYFGLRQDIVVAPQQRLVVGGPEVEYLFGREYVLIPAASLLQGYAAVREPAPQVVEYVQLLLPAHDAIRTPDAALESLYVGRIRRDRHALAASVLATEPRASLPEHHRAGYQVLKPFEAISLADARAA